MARQKLPLPANTDSDPPHTPQRLWAIDHPLMGLVVLVGALVLFGIINEAGLKMEIFTWVGGAILALSCLYALSNLVFYLSKRGLLFRPVTYLIGLLGGFAVFNGIPLIALLISQSKGAAIEPTMVVRVASSCMSAIVIAGVIICYLSVVMFGLSCVLRLLRWLTRGSSQ